MKDLLIILLLILNITISYGQSKNTDTMNDSLTQVKGVVISTQQLSNSSFVAQVSSFRNISITVDSSRLKYPDSYTLFNSGDEVVFWGSYKDTDSFDFRMDAYEFRFVQTKEQFEKICSLPFTNNQVQMDNIISFYTSEGISKVSFALRIKNLGNDFIPALNAQNNGMRLHTDSSNSVTEFYINGESRGLAIYNGISHGYEVLNKGGASEIAEKYTLLDDSGIMMHGNTITVQWRYMGILSYKYKVDLKKQIITKIN